MNGMRPPKVEAKVVGYNKGGLLVNLDGVRGFVPASQVTEIRGGDEASKQADMARLIAMDRDAYCAEAAAVAWLAASACSRWSQPSSG